MLTRKTSIAVRTETTKGTSEQGSFTNSDFLLAEDVTPAPPTEMLERDVYQDSLSKMPSIPGRREGTLSCRVEFKGSGTVSTAPPMAALLKGCGFKETVSTAGVTYEPASDDADTDTVTILAYLDGKRYEIYGARGNVTFEWNANELVRASFDFTGIFEAVTDNSLSSDSFSPSYSSVIPPQFKNSNTKFNFGTAGGGEWATAVFSTFSLDMGNDVTLRDNANASDGLAYSMITNRNPTGSIDVDAVLEATQPFWTLWQNSTTGSFEMTLGDTAGNKVKLSGGALQLTEHPPGDRDGIRTTEVGFAFRKNSTGDDEIDLLFF